MKRVATSMFCLLSGIGCLQGGDTDNPDLFSAPYCETQRDVDIDGTMDALFHPTFERALLMRLDIDEGADGAIDARETFVYDSSGNQLRLEYDEELDTVLDYLEVRTFDDDGNELTYRQYSDGGSELDYAINSFYTADDRIERREYDTDGDGTIDVTGHYMTNASGLIVRTDWTDEVGPGDYDQYRYREGLFIRMERRNIEDVLTRVRERSYDSLDRPTRTIVDEDADGVADRTNVYEWDADDRLIRWDLSYLPDGFRRRDTRSYDCLGSSLL